MSLEARKKMSIAKIGYTPWNKGKKVGKGSNTSFKKGSIPWNKGIPHTEITKNKLKIKLRKIAKERGFGKWMRGKHHSVITIKKMSEARKGDKCYLWRGGISKNPYPMEFNKKLKLRIRTRDNFICCLCERTEREELEDLNQVLSVNHIDFDKNNCKESNLNTLCSRCNTKINRDRDHWTNYFNTI